MNYKHRERLNRHDAMYAEIQRLQKELDTAKSQIVELEEANRRLRQQLAQPQQTRTLEDDDFPSLSTHTQQVPTTNTTASP
ncbi:hypothetical protein EC973_005648 [Apophysomyces ossiformis]|uniref:Uncharacterized protein n=1 Tax=Apophysomyces ossiformis TaxID=679940 RepID=A0A8H7ELY9_9FUNG|nr:hypothetical protein EC973_005648 [Apophysomyces ossiformis]